MPPITRVWHTIDVIIGAYAIKKEPSKLNWVRLLFAFIGLFGNVVIAKVEEHRK